MKDVIKGLAYVVGDSIDTDQIIPASHLVYSMSIPDERKMYGRYALSGLPTADQGLPDGNIPFTEEDAYESSFKIIIAGTNFGCGSSREHAPFALMVAGAEAVIAESYARIFYRNSVDGGFLVPFESRERLIDSIRTGDLLTIDSKSGIMTNETQGVEILLNPLGDVADILKAGNVFEYARQAGLMPK
ncbi:MAG TPA: 3-isopropylmalate dehydratase [Bacteroidetes bacterium]|nr:3-isopropylmalate dehydratase [Bacteroidota bacterium]